MHSSKTKRIKNECCKAMTVRFYSENDSDLIDMAVLRSGLEQSEWSRQALITLAEMQVLRGGFQALTLKNTFMVRRLLQLSGQFSEAQISEAMKWAASEFEKIISTRTITKGDPDE